MIRNVLDLVPTQRVMVIDADTKRPEELLIEFKRKIVELGDKRVIFGRYPAPDYTDVRLPGRIVARRLFDVRWNEKYSWHEVAVYPCVYPPSLNGRPLISGEPNPPFIGDVLTIGPFRLEYTALKRSEMQIEP